MSHERATQTAQLYRLLGGKLYATALRILRSPEEAEDAVQDAFVTYHRQAAGFEPDSAGGWLHRVVVNRCLDRLRARDRRREAGFDEADVDQGAGALAAGAPVRDSIDLERAVAALPEGARRVFLLYDVEGFRHAEVAARLGISEGTSKSQLFRAREMLRAALAPAQEERP